MRPKLDEMLKGLNELGLAARLGNASFTDKTVTFKVEIGIVSEDGAVETKERAAFRALAPLLGFEDKDLGYAINLRGDTYTIEGYVNTGRKLPVLLKRIKDGKMYTFGVNDVLRALGRTPKPSGPSGIDRDVFSARSFR